MRKWLPFAQKLTAEIGDFVSGARIQVAQLPGGALSSMICYEAIFPDQVRLSVKQGAEALVNISNDGWYGSSAARDQHLLQARMRAIENDRYLLRATNTGITAAIRPNGQLETQLLPDKSAVLSARWAFRKQQSVYTLYGDWFAMAASALTIIALGISFGAGRRNPS
jgi:apolipoprotein N-acyltransferase